MHDSSKLLAHRFSNNNQFYSVTICCINRAPLFKEFGNACIAAKAIVDMQNKVNTICYVLMPDHLHWLFQLKECSLANVIKIFKSVTTLKINKLNGTTGKIWQQNYFEHQLRSEKDLINQARYIVANPLRTGIVKSVGQYPFWDCIYLN